MDIDKVMIIRKMIVALYFHRESEYCFIWHLIWFYLCASASEECETGKCICIWKHKTGLKSQSESVTVMVSFIQCSRSMNYNMHARTIRTGRDNSESHNVHCLSIHRNLQR